LPDLTTILLRQRHRFNNNTALNLHNMSIKAIVPAALQVTWTFVIEFNGNIKLDYRAIQADQTPTQQSDQ
jgi:hypothetical protein